MEHRVSASAASHGNKRLLGNGKSRGMNDYKARKHRQD